MSVAVAQQPVAVPNKKAIAFEPPTTWRVVPLYHLFNSVGGATPSKDNDDYWKGDIPWVSPKDMKSSVVFDSIDHISQSALSETRLSLLPVGTVLIVVRGMILAHTIPIATTSTKVTINQDMKGLAAKPGVKPDFLAYLLRAISPLLFSTIEESGHGTRCLRLDLWRNILVGVPLEDEQDRILSFIERKTAQIDAVVAKKQRLIERLQEKRQALISHAVTKGLDPHTPMKDSGIEWLGEIPAHWSVLRLKRLCSVLKDGTHLPPPRTDSGFPLLSVRNIVDGRFINLPDDSMISEEDFRELTKTVRPQAGDVLLAIVGATMGKVAIVEEMPPFAIQRSLGIFRTKPRLLHPEYLAYWLRGWFFQRLLWENTGFSAQPGIYLGALADFPATVPPIEEQRQLVAELNGSLRRVDAAIEKLTLQISKLQEFRQTLISAAVTGKIDVTKEAAC